MARHLPIARMNLPVRLRGNDRYVNIVASLSVLPYGGRRGGRDRFACMKQVRVLHEVARVFRETLEGSVHIALLCWWL